MNTDKIYAENIANEYSKKDDAKVIQLKKLDNKAKLPSEIFAYSFGILGALVLGIGMCLSMKVIGSGNVAFIGGIIIGIVGIIMVSINYPIYTKIRTKGKAKYANDIMRLAKEISEESIEE
jgi:hypothetical protein